MSFVPSKLLEWVTEKLLKKILKIFVDIYLRIAPESDKVELFRKHFEKYVQKQSDESYLGLINSLSKELQNKSENIEKSKNIEILLSNLFHNTLRFKSKVKRLFGDSIGYIILLRKRTEKIQDIDDILLKEKIADKKLSEKNIFGGKTFVKFRSNLTNEVIRKLEKIINNKYRFLVLPFYLSPDVSFVSNENNISKIFRSDIITTVNEETFKRILLECELCSFGDITNVNEENLNRSSESENIWRKKTNFKNNKQLYHFIKNNPQEIDKIVKDLQNTVYKWTTSEDVKEWLNSLQRLFSTLTDVKFIS